MAINVSALRRLFRKAELSKAAQSEKTESAHAVMDLTKSASAKEEITETQIKTEIPIIAKDELKPVSLPKVYEKVTTSREDIQQKLRQVTDNYPLITTRWHGARYVVATANITFNPVSNQLNYRIEEPPLDNRQRDLILKTIDLLQSRLEVDFSALKAKKEVYAFVDKKVNEIWEYLGVKLKPEEELKIKYYIFRDTIGLGKIEALMRDPNIEDISADGVGIPVFIFHRNPLYGEMSTNISFSTRQELDSFVMRLAQKSGKTVSVATPLLDATLPDNSRLQATFGTDIARKGSNFSIRKFFKAPLTVVDLMNYGTVNPLILAYLWFAVEEQQSVLVSGGTATGKTTFLNSISQFIHPTLKIVSIEDTAELMLPQVNWVPQIARSGYGPKKYGEVSMFDLLKAALRQRPDYIIVGEVRGEEANVMFQAMATGHPSLSTIHADRMEAVIDRLTTRPISLPLALLEHLDIVLFLEKTKKAGKFTRRVSQVLEIVNYDRDANKLKTAEVFKWLPAEDEFISEDSYILARIAQRLGKTPGQIKEEIMRRAGVLRWMVENNIRGFKDVAHIIDMYYVDPKRLETMMELQRKT